MFGLSGVVYKEAINMAGSKNTFKKAAFNLIKEFLARGVAVEQSHQKGDIVANQKTQNVH